MLCCPGGFIILIEAKLEVLQPLDLLVTIVLCTLGADDILDHDASILMELITPVTVVTRLKMYQVDVVVLWLLALGSRCFNFGGSHGRRNILIGNELEITLILNVRNGIEEVQIVIYHDVSCLVIGIRVKRFLIDVYCFPHPHTDWKY